MWCGWQTDLAFQTSANLARAYSPASFRTKVGTYLGYLNNVGLNLWEAGVRAGIPAPFGMSSYDQVTTDDCRCRVLYQLVERVATRLVGFGAVGEACSLVAAWRGGKGCSRCAR